MDHHDGRRRTLALGIGEVGGDRIPTARELYIFGVNVGAVEGGRGRWRAVEVGQSEQHSRQHRNTTAYLHRLPPPYTALHRPSAHSSPSRSDCPRRRSLAPAVLENVQMLGRDVVAQVVAIV